MRFNREVKILSKSKFEEVVIIKEYLGVYDQSCIQLFTAKISADSEEDARNKFMDYIKGHIDFAYYHDNFDKDDVYVLDLNKLEVL